MNSFCAVADIRGSQLDFLQLREMGETLTHSQDSYAEACIDRGIGLFSVGASKERGEARQPYATTTANGELYTAISRTPVGVDVAKALADTYIKHGYDTPRELGGHFALAVLDRRRRELYLATDSLGAKPIFIHSDGEKIVISTSIKPLLRYSPACGEVDRAAVLELIRAPDGEITASDIYKNISELGGGRFMIFSGLGAQIFDYRAKEEAPPTPPAPLTAQSISPNKHADLKKCVEEMTLALDYPSFECYTPEYISAIRAAALDKKEVLIASKRQRLFNAHTYRKLYALGERFGVEVYLSESENDLSIRKGFLAEREKKLSEIAASILSDERSHIRRLFGRSLETVVSKESDISAKIGIWGKIIGLEHWLESYPIVPI